MVIDELIRIYYEEENWHKEKLSRTEAYKYYKKLLEEGRILVYEELGEVIGYVESWKINFEQFGRLVCHAPFCAYKEDINSGNISYVANTWIRKDRRRGNVYKALRLGYYRQNSNCEYYVGSALRKKTQPIKVFKKTEAILNKYR